MSLLKIFIPNEDDTINKLNKLRAEINIYSNNIKKIINGLNHLIENMETYYKIFDKILTNYNIKNKNYQVLKNINEINIDNNIFREIYDINKSKNYMEKVDNILNIYYKMKGKQNLDPFGFFNNNSTENINLEESNTLFLFSDIPSHIKNETKISRESIYRCNYCPYTPLMKVMYKEYKVYIEYRCQNGHYDYEKLYDFYQRNKKNSINAAICSIGYEINDGQQDFYYCNDCGKYFCEKDKSGHEINDEKAHKLINLKNIDNICNEHSNIITDYCLNCHKNICNKCQSHSNHKRISISKLMISDNKIKEYRNKLNKLKEVLR